VLAPTAAPPTTNKAQPEKRKRVNNEIRSQILFLFMFLPPVNFTSAFLEHIS
jgi:hypothetical protein